MAGFQKSEKGPSKATMGRPPKTRSRYTLMREAAKVKYGCEHAEPEVQLWVAVRDKDPIKFAQLFKEEEDAAKRKRKPGSGIRKPAEDAAPEVPKVVDDYDRTSDKVSPVVLELCERWLKNRRAELDEKLAKAGRAPSGEKVA